MTEYKKDEWKADLEYRIRLRIYKKGLVFGPGICELLEKVEAQGSLSAACREMGMAYSKGWKIIKRAEEDFKTPLVHGTRGGADGGRMTLTDTAKEVIRCYNAMNQELDKQADKLFQKHFREKQEIKNLIIVRGGGDIATGTIHRLWSAGYAVLVLEAEHPAAIRRQVSICEAVYEGYSQIEGMEGVRIEQPEQAAEIIRQGKVPVLVDPEGAAIEALHPVIVVDAILAKQNLGTHCGMAELTVALGPGFTAGEDVDLVIETKRGHNLGRIIRQGPAAPNSGVPGMIGGYAEERVIHAEAEGTLRNIHQIGDIVEKGEVIAVIETSSEKTCVSSGEKESGGVQYEYAVRAKIPGIIRGLIRDGYPVTKGFKIADVDPRIEELQNCFTISDKSRCIAGSVLEVVAGFVKKRDEL
jgi:xanthine dehydrogenase accessory factor